MADETYPQELRYYKEHDWVRVDGRGRGLRHHLVRAGCARRDRLRRAARRRRRGDGGQPYGELESVKAVSDVFSPLTGEVVEVNEALQDEPQRVNDDCYGEGWLIRIRMTAPGELGDLMDADAYKKFLDEA